VVRKNENNNQQTCANDLSDSYVSSPPGADAAASLTLMSLPLLLPPGILTPLLYTHHLSANTQKKSKQQSSCVGATMINLSGPIQSFSKQK